MDMRDDLKQDYTRRITSANKSQLVVILYDMFDQYLNDAKESINVNNFSDLHTEIRRARNVLSELIISLDMKYEVSGNLYSVYRYIERLLIKADIKRISEPIDEARRLMGKLGDSFREVAKTDTDSPIMKNTEAVFAGITYGREDVNENAFTGSNRGYLV